MTTHTDKTIVLTPILSEKAYAASQATNTYVFGIPAGANKHTVARAIEAQFEVSVVSVNILNLEGKSKRTITKRGRVANGRQNAVRKAYVTLKNGDSLPIFAALEEDAKEAEKAAKSAKKDEKGKDK